MQVGPKAQKVSWMDDCESSTHWPWLIIPFSIESRESITWSQFQAPLLRFYSWSLPRSTTVRHSSIGSRKKIETNSIYLRYTNGTRFTSPQTCCKRAQTYINQTHSKAFREISDVYLCKNFSKCRFSFLFRVFLLLAKNNLFPLEKELTNTERLRLEESVVDCYYG